MQYRQFIKSQEVDEVILCSLCKDSWERPTELGPCGHIFCESCISEYGRRSTGSPYVPGAEGTVALLCPKCGHVVEQSECPNRVLVNKALEVQVQCVRCKWKGTREQSQNHTCPPLPPSEPPEALACMDDASVADEHLSRLLSHSEEIYSAPGSRTMCPANNGRVPRHVLVDDDEWKKYGLTQIEYDQMVGVFIAFDTDNSGFLTRSQLRQLVFALNYVNRDEHVDRMLFEMGCEERGGVTVHDLCAWLGNHRPNSQALFGLSQLEYNEALLQFRGYDSERRGFLSWNGFSRLCLNNGYARSIAEARKLFRSCARTSKSHVSLYEFLLFCKRHQSSHGGSTEETLAPRSRPHRLLHHVPGAAPVGAGVPLRSRHRKKRNCVLM